MSVDLIPHIRGTGKICSHSKYRMTCDEFELLRQRAGDRCEICGVRGEDTPHGKLHIDHDYAIGDRGVRGLLCSRCNSHMDKDSVVSPEARSRYLANPFHLLIADAQAARAHSPRPRRKPAPVAVSGLDADEGDRVVILGRLYAKMKAETDERRERLHKAIVAEWRVGATVTYLARESGYEREIIRRILNKAREAGELPPLSD